MDVIQAIKTRKSIRGFKPDPVPQNVLMGILEIATRAPSAENSQPWGITVITGDVLEKIRQSYWEKFELREPSRQEVSRGSYTGKYRERQIALGVQIYQLMGIGINDLEKKIEWAKRGVRFFDAPTVIILSWDDSVGNGNQFDVGSLAQTIALVAVQYGLGTCMQGVRYPDVFRKFVDMPQSYHIAIGLAIGYPDWDFPANRVQSEREPIDNITAWIGFE